MRDVLDVVTEVTGASAASRRARIQSLWSGYGEIFRVELRGHAVATAIVKWVRPPRGAAGSLSDVRKRRSYDVETAFYRGVASRCGASCRVPRLLGSHVDDDEWVLVLEDLDALGLDTRPTRRGGRSLEACLAWLASFHATFLGVHAHELWPSGTYWHLATRTDELARIEDAALREAAPRIDALLARTPFPTLVHGDAKEANFCFRPDGSAAAAVDFQYVGGGAAMKDVAYLLYGRPDEPDDAAGSHLDRYFALLREALGRRADRPDVAAVESAWRRAYPLARLDFCRFLAGWAPDHWREDGGGRRFVARALRDGTLDGG